MKKNQWLLGLITGIAGSIGCMLLALICLQYTGKINLANVIQTSQKSSQLKKEISVKGNLLEAYIDEYFLEKIDGEKMADSVYKGIVNGLGDDYAAYYTKKEYQEIQEKSQGVYCGIGAYIATDSETGLVSIQQPMKNSPSEKAGLKAGDIIYAVDGEEMTGKEISQVQAKVKGKENSKVTLTVIRDKKKLDIEVIRGKIEEDTVSSRMLDNKIGYVQVSSFEEVTPKQFKKAIKKLEAKGEKGLLIDLRENGGGLLDSAVDMLDQMLPKGLVVYSKDKKGSKQEYYAKDDKAFTKPVVILVNGNSASASEVFSGAMQDKKAATLVGTQTFGKGIVQGVYSLGDGTALKMTVAKYYTPKGRNIHKKGLTPDVKVSLSKKMETLPKSGLKVDNQLKTGYDYLLKEIANS